MTFLYTILIFCILIIRYRGISTGASFWWQEKETKEEETTSLHYHYEEELTTWPTLVNTSSIAVKKHPYTWEMTVKKDMKYAPWSEIFGLEHQVSIYISVYCSYQTGVVKSYLCSVHVPTNMCAGRGLTKNGCYMLQLRPKINRPYLRGINQCFAMGSFIRHQIDLHIT